MRHGKSNLVHPQSITQFEEFFMARTRALENLGLSVISSGLHKENSATFSTKPRSKIAAHVATSSPNQGSSTCPLCQSSHYLAKCDQYLAKNQQKRELILKHRRCFNCLGPHAASKCTSTRRCLKCGKKHHTTIHDSN